MNPRPKDCKRAARLLQQAFAGELSLQDRLWWEAHRAQCPSCDTEARDQERIVDALATYREAPLQHVDLDRFVDGVQARLEPREPSISAGRGWPRAGQPLLAAASVLACVGLGWWWMQEEPAGPADVSNPSVAQSESKGTSPGVDSVAQSEPKGTGPGADAESEVASGPLAPEWTTPFLPETPRALNLIEPGEAFDEERRAQVLTELGQTLADPQADREAYLRGLRLDGWPVASLLARVARQGESVAAQAAIDELAAIGDRGALRHLWSLHDLPEIGEPAVSALLALRPVPFEYVTRLYATEGHRDAVRASWQQWTDEEAQRGAERLHHRLARSVRRGSPARESLSDLASLLGRGGAPALAQGLDWLVSESLDTEAWAGALAAQPGLDRAVRDWFDQREGRPLRRGQAQALLPLAAAHLDPVWTEWVSEQCRDSRTSAEALAILGQVPQPPALAALYQLRHRSGVDREAWVEAWRAGLELDRERTDRLSIYAVPSNQSPERFQEDLRAYGEALLLAPSRNTSRAMAWVAQGLGSVDALALALWEQAGLHGDAWTLDLVEHAWRELADNELRKAAAVWLCAGGIGGEPTLRGWLPIDPQATPNHQEQRRLDAATKPSNRSFRERVYLLERSMRDGLAARPPFPTE